MNRNLTLYIQANGDQAINHPILEENLLMTHPGASVEDLAALGYIPFIPNRPPSNVQLPVGTFQVPVKSYGLGPSGKNFQQKWTVRDMTEAEKAEFIASTNANAVSTPVDLSKVTFA